MSTDIQSYYNIEADKGLDLGAKTVGSETYAGVSDIYPEISFKERLVGHFCPLDHGDVRLQDLFPFYEVIITPIQLGLEEKDFIETYGMALEQLVELTELGTIVPVIDHFGGSVTAYTESVLKRGYPSVHRAFYFWGALNSGLAGSNSFGDAVGGLNLFWQVVARGIEGRHGYWDENGNLDYLSRMATLISFSLGAPTAWNFFLDALERDAANAEAVFRMLKPLALANGVNLAMTDGMHGLLRTFTDLKKFGEVNLLGTQRDFLASHSDVLALSGIDKHFAVANTPSVGELMVEMRKSFFYSPPEYYGDPVKYAYYLAKSDNVREHWRILKAFELDIERGRYRSVFAESGRHYERLMTELNRELALLDRRARRLEFSVRFGALLLGGITGAAAGQALKSAEIASVLGFCGASALLAMTKDSVADLSKKLLSTRHGSYLLWRHERSTES